MGQVLECRAIRSIRYKLIQLSGPSCEELYDISSDPHETPSLLAPGAATPSIRYSLAACLPALSLIGGRAVADRRAETFCFCVPVRRRTQLHPMIRRHARVLRHMFAVLTLVALDIGWSVGGATALPRPLAGQSSERAGTPGTASLVLKLDFPLDSTREERRALVGSELTLVGRSDHLEGPREERVTVMVADDLRIRAEGLHPWIYGLEVTSALAPDQLDESIRGFRLALDQFYYPREGRLVSEPAVLERGLHFEGMVVNEAGLPAAGAEVAAVWARQSIHGLGARQALRCDGEGRFRFENVPTGLTSLEARISPTASVLLSGSALRLAMVYPLKVRLQTRETPADMGGWIDVLSIDRKGDVLPASQCKVSITSHFGVPIEPGVTGARDDGVLRYGPLSPAGYRVQREVRSHDRHAYLMILEDVRVIAGEAVRLTLDESAANHDVLKTSVRGSVYFDDAKVPGASVTVSDEMGIVARGFTDREGLYDLALATAGPFVLAAKDARTDSAVAVSIELQPGERKWTVMKLRTRIPTHASPARSGFARAAMNAGDLNGDGADDLLITESLDDIVPWQRASTRAVSGATGQLLLEVPQNRFRRFCIGVGGVGDVDGDGTPDFVTRFEGRTGSNSPMAQGLQLRSGKNGAPLLEHGLPPLEGVREMSATARVVGDHNGDGIQDIAVARRRLIQRKGETVSIEILGGADFESIRRFDVNLLDGGRGEWCFPGDLDLDGVEDLVIRGIRPPDQEPRLFALSGRTQRSIGAWEQRMLSYGKTDFTPAGDLDGDGAADLFVMSAKTHALRRVEVTLRAISGSTGAILAEHVRILADVDGIELVPLPDLDGDGAQDLLLTSHGTFFTPDDPDGVSVHSGADLSLLYSLKSPFQHAFIMDHFGVDGFSLNDLNRDGVPDIAVRAMNAYGASKGYVQLFSGKDGEPLRTITRESIRRR